MNFDISIVSLINILFIAAGIGVCGLCFLQITSSRHIRKEVRNYFQLFFVLITLYISTHLVREIMNGIPGAGVRVTLQIVTFVELAVAGLMAQTMSVLVAAVAKREQNIKPVWIMLLCVLGVHLVILIASLPFGFVYYFDADNVYHRGAGYLLSNLCPIIMLAVDTYLLIKYRKNFTGLTRVAFWNYLVAPLVAVAIQAFFYGVQLIIFATVGATVFMFGVILKDQNAKYEKQQQESSRIETELTLASNIQADMVPNIYPAFPDRDEFDIYATMDPAKEVGGDFYDFFLIDSDHLCMVMADVSGKGVPAALFMMASKIILANNAMIGKSPAQILTDTNDAICSNNREEMFVTVWLGILEISTGKLTAANAGHEYPVVKHAGGKFEIFKDKHGFVIGGMAGAKYKEYEMTLEPGARLFLYTDGVPEATNGNNELFGMDRVLGALNENVDAGTVEMLKTVRRSVDEFVKEAEQFDDLTMLGFEYKGVKQ